jgi:hypothetical protein
MREFIVCFFYLATAGAIGGFLFGMPFILYLLPSFRDHSFRAQKRWLSVFIAIICTLLSLIAGVYAYLTYSLSIQYDDNDKKAMSDFGKQYPTLINSDGDPSCVLNESTLFLETFKGAIGNYGRLAIISIHSDTPQLPDPQYDGLQDPFLLGEWPETIKKKNVITEDLKLNIKIKYPPEWLGKEGDLTINYQFLYPRLITDAKPGVLESADYYYSNASIQNTAKLHVRVCSEKEIPLITKYRDIKYAFLERNNKRIIPGDELQDAIVLLINAVFFSAVSLVNWRSFKVLSEAKKKINKYQEQDRCSRCGWLKINCDCNKKT